MLKMKVHMKNFRLILCLQAFFGLMSFYAEQGVANQYSYPTLNALSPDEYARRARYIDQNGFPQSYATSTAIECGGLAFEIVSLLYFFSEPVFVYQVVYKLNGEKRNVVTSMNYAESGLASPSVRGVECVFYRNREFLILQGEIAGSSGGGKCTGCRFDVVVDKQGHVVSSSYNKRDVNISKLASGITKNGRKIRSKTVERYPVHLIN